MKNPIDHFGFHPENYRLLFIGLAINVLGYILMIGGGAESLNEFNADELFSTTRITVAPILIVLGYGIILFSVMKKSKKSAVKASTISEDCIVNFIAFFVLSQPVAIILLGIDHTDFW